MPKSRSKSTGIPYTRPVGRRPPSLGLAGPASAIGIRGCEVVQCVQDLENSVPLVAGKSTVVRLYLDPATVAKSGTVTAEIAWTTGGAEAYLPALNNVKVDPAKPGVVRDQREDLTKSLNFQLPDAATAVGDVAIRLSRVFVPGGADLPVGTPAPVRARFITMPPLRIRVIGLRYKNGTATVAPAAIHFSYLKSFLLRAYPVASLEWSHIVVDADFSAPFNDSTVDLANAQIAALRSREVSSGVDPRTHYYGMVDDNGSRNFMRGKAFAIPASAHPDVVASGPAGVPNGFAGDQDASYADWYGAHELGHTFGRFHPGFPPGQQDASDPAFPYTEGNISTPDNRFVGLDPGDAELGLPMMSLAGRQHHDIMTYADNQWISPYTYQAILTRLTAEAALA
jgi:hypothetical protein